MKESIDSDKTLFPGLRLLDRYELSEPIARGGMAWVWRAKHLALGCSVAIKFTLRNDDEAVRRFLQEARTVATLSSPHIVHVFDVGLFEGVPFLVMELLRGETLEERLLARGKLESSETVAILAQVAQGMDVAHEAGVIHRDLKPSNIFLVKSGEVEVAKVLDFGVSRDLVSRGTQPGEFVGTPHYISPEQAADPSKVDARSDYWSLAVIAFECVVGKRPFRGVGIPQLLNEICHEASPIPSQEGAASLGFDSWFARAAAKKPSQRFQSAREFRDSLRSALIEEHEAQSDRGRELRVGTHPGEHASSVETVLSRPTGRQRRNKVALAISVLALSVVLWWSLGSSVIEEGGSHKSAPLALEQAKSPSLQESAASSLEGPSPHDTTLGVENLRPSTQRFQERAQSISPEPLAGEPQKPRGSSSPKAPVYPPKETTGQSSKVPALSTDSSSEDEELWRHRK